MLEIIPAIDLIDGECVRLYRGDYARKVVYSSKPPQVAYGFEKLGARRLHVVDLDGAKAGFPRNLDVVKQIVDETNLSVELGGGIRNEGTLEKVFEAGVDYAILGTAAIEDEPFLRWAAERFPDRIILGVDAKDGKVAVRGWLEESDQTATGVIERLNSLPLGGVIYTDIARDGAMVGPNLESLVKVADVSEMDVTASGGISTIEDVRHIAELRHSRVVSAIIGKALYEKKIDLAEAIEIGRSV